MKLQCSPSTLRGAVDIPGSKSHTIRAVAIAALADGESCIEAPLDSADTRSARAAYAALGAHIDDSGLVWRIQGVAGLPTAPVAPIDVGNSGTTMNVALGSCALLRAGKATLTGDEQVQRRPSDPLVQSLNDLGARIVSQRVNGCPPFDVAGTLRGGRTSLEATSSQYLSSLLMSTPLAENDSDIDVPLLHERPYVGITLDWLERQGVAVDAADDWSAFHVPGGQQYQPVNRRIPADFSSATFFLVAGALPGNDVECLGLDYNDTQGDKAVVEYLREMGADVEITLNAIRIRAKELNGCELDLNATPDALPMMAVLACFAQGETRLVNVPQARQKETDRIAVMCQELRKLGADIEELEDGLVIRESRLRGGLVDGHGDHRVVMALAIGASQAEGHTTILGSEAVGITFPTFIDALGDLGGHAKPQPDDAGVPAQ